VVAVMRKFNPEELIKLTEIFWQNIKTDGDSYPCWLWTGEKSHHHYDVGQPQFNCKQDEFPVFCEDYDSRLVNIPRFSLYLMEETDTLLYNAEIYWTCNNPSKCCNPEHIVVDDGHLDRIPY
jgi:hypothetical protein